MACNALTVFFLTSGKSSKHLFFAGVQNGIYEKRILHVGTVRKKSTLIPVRAGTTLRDMPGTGELQYFPGIVPELLPPASVHGGMFVQSAETGKSGYTLQGSENISGNPPSLTRSSPVLRGIIPLQGSSPA
jgi:hypothetical protein